jgi:hypothetical protein
MYQKQGKIQASLKLQKHRYLPLSIPLGIRDEQICLATNRQALLKIYSKIQIKSKRGFLGVKYCGVKRINFIFCLELHVGENDP